VSLVQAAASVRNVEDEELWRVLGVTVQESIVTIPVLIVKVKDMLDAGVATEEMDYVQVATDLVIRDAFLAVDLAHAIIVTDQVK
jgi:hypothetical protein